MKKLQRILIACLLCGLFTACAATTGNSSAPASQTGESSATTAELSAAEERLASMTLREKVGQLFIIRPDALDPSLSMADIADAYAAGVTAFSDSMRDTLRDYPVGGVAVFGKNITGPEQIKTFLSSMQSASRITLFTGIDEEGGRVARLANHSAFNLPQYTSMADVGASGDPEKAHEVGLTIGGYLKQYGFNLDFAPVADVNTNPDNPVIGARAFSSDPNTAAKMVTAEIDGLHEAGVMSSIKHFPGHGDTKSDTHLGYASTEKTWDQMLSCEMLPFRAGIAAGTDFVMAAHITAVNVTTDGLPASLSPEMITGKLRGELQYQGLVITDSLAMGAITSQYTSSQAAVAALKAGVDVLLMPEDYRAAFDGVVAAVNDGTISQSRLDESVLRVLTLKEHWGMLK